MSLVTVIGTSEASGESLQHAQTPKPGLQATFLFRPGSRLLPAACGSGFSAAVHQTIKGCEGRNRAQPAAGVWSGQFAPAEL